MSDFIKNMAQYQRQYDNSVRQPEQFWAKQAAQFQWFGTWKKVVEWDFVTHDVKWFVGGKTNICYNALDRHLATRGDKTAIIWEPNQPNEATQRLSYRELHAKVCQFANVLRKNGIKKGDRVCLYMPMIPELAIATLACARIGAIHSVVFGGFSAQALADRINDAQAALLVTSDGVFRGEKELKLKEIADEALTQCPSVATQIVFQRTACAVNWVEKRDKWWHDEMKNMPNTCEIEIMDSEDMLFILYTSGSTGKPKGVVHTTGGYMVYVNYTFSQVFQVKPKDIYWCTADIGWITGHSYIVYAPLLAGATTLMFEGIPTFPDAGRFWQVIDKHQVTHFYTAPTAIRALMAAGLQHVAGSVLSSLKLLGSVGEPINEEAWHWYHKYIGKSRCPIVDTWWQTETGGIMISPIPNVTKQKPTMATLPLPGVQPCLLTPEGKEIEGNNVEGLLCIKYPWPGIIRTTYGDHERARAVYFGAFPGYYFTGDGARRDEDGYYRIIGRVDDVINVSGHRIGTAEVEDAINKHHAVVESAVVGYPHDIKGQGIYAFIIADKHIEDENIFKIEVLKEVTKQIGAIAKPDIIQVVTGLPKTRSGKIMRRILRKIAEGDVSNLGDISTLLDPSVVEHIKANAPTLK
ncbi:MAG: acetate--CoA ligase [Bacteroidota bacterium]|jgi:acetyl-CoA synthetase